MNKKNFVLRAPRRWVSIATTALVVAMVVAPLTAIASHSFTDVPDSHTFHSDIEFLKDSGVTKGCNPPANTLFCPDDNVTRGQMAAFLKRFADYVDANTLGPEDLAVTSAQGYDWFTAGFNITLAATGTPIVETSITTSADGHLMVLGHAALGNSGTASALYTVWIELDDGTCGITALVPDTSVSGATTYSADGPADDYSAAVNGVVAVTEGTHTVTLCGASAAGDGDSFNANVVAQFLSDASTSAVSSASNQSPADGPNGG